MTNQQLYLAIGAPIVFGTLNLVIVLIGFLVQGRSIDRRFDQVDKRFDQVDKRFDRLESRMDRVDATLNEVHLMLGRHDGRLDALEKQKS